ncbi:MAG TPA: murein biosynthesis integral membrane protein MurJ, partial [Anaerolineae bacterium]|nr:murein biosynthesis integral membrane protein MurJ [Anaerolineae bacterium]
MTSSKQRIARAAGIVVVAFTLSRVLGLAREMIIGQQFGTSGELDAYLAAFRLPDILFQLVAGGALGSAFIPTFSGYLARGDEREAWRLTSAVINLVLVLLSALALLAAAFAPLLVAKVVAPGFDPAKRALTAQLMRLMLLSPVIFGVSGIVMGVLNSYQHFLLPALAPIAYNLSIIGAALFLSPSLGIRSLAVGVVVGSLLHLAVQVPALVRRGLRYSLILGLGEPGVREVGRLMAPRVLGLAVVQLNFLVNTILASGLADGSLAALNFAWLLMLLPQGIFAQALATAAFPTFSELAAKRQVAEMRSTLSATLRAILYLAIPASVGLFALRYPIVQLLFQRGAFKESSTEAVVWALQFYALGLFAHAVVEIVTRAFYALHDTLTPVLVGVGAMSINVVLSLILIRPLAHGGLALANSTATILEMVGLLLVIRGRLEGLEGGRLLGSTLRTALAASLMGFGVSWFAAGTHGLSIIIVGGGGMALGGVIYFVATL